MSIDTTAPRSRRALLFGALGGAVASVAAFARPSVTRAGVDGDVILDAVNTAAGTTEIDGASSDPVLRIVGGARGIESTSDTGVGVFGASGSSAPFPDPIAASTGVYGVSVAGHGVYGASDTGVGVYAANNSSTVAAIVAEGEPGTAIHGHANAGPVPASPALTGVYGSATAAGVALAADSASGLAVRATSSAGHGIRGRGQMDGVIGESPGARSGVVGYSGGGSAPAGPAKTGVYGEATQDTASRGVSGYTLAGQGVRGEATTGQGVQAVATSGNAVKADSTSGLAILATSSLGNAIRGHGAVDGIVGESPANSGIVGYSGPGPTPPGGLKVGVYGEAHQSSSAAGVAGRTSIGQGVRGQADSGIGVRAISVTGDALNVSGKVKLDRSGRASIPANRDYVDVTVPGGVVATALGFANLQTKRTGVYVAAVRPAYPTTSVMRIYLNKVASTTSSTAVAWMVLS